MGKRGPKPKPTALRIIDGDRKDRINEHEPKPSRQRRAAPAPSWLSDDAAKIFRRNQKILIEARVLTKADLDHLANGAALQALFEKVAGLVDAAPMLPSSSGSLRSSPAGPLLLGLAASIRGYSADLGLNPSARSAIRASESVDVEAGLRSLLR